MSGSFLKELEELLNALFKDGQACSDHSWPERVEEAKQAILELITSIVPDELLDKPTTGETFSAYHKGWNDCMSEILRRLEA